MGAVLTVNQHELAHPDNADLSKHQWPSWPLVFGTADTNYLTTSHPSIEDGDPTTNDLPAMREDGLVFGEDFLTGSTVTFEVQVMTDREAGYVRDAYGNPIGLAKHLAAADALSEFKGRWQHALYRNKSSAYAVLRSHMTPGRVRRAYGRPRRFAETTDGSIRSGFSSFICDFTVRDGRWYSDEPEYVEARPYIEDTTPVVIGGEPKGKLTGPVSMPPRVTPGGGPVGIDVAGDCPTPFWLELHGPINGPVIHVGDSIFSLPSVNMAYGQYLIIDTRPWNRVVMGGTTGMQLRANMTFQSTPLRAAKLNPGPALVYVNGTSGYDTRTKLNLMYRPAYTRW